MATVVFLARKSRHLAALVKHVFLQRCRAFPGARRRKTSEKRRAFFPCDNDSDDNDTKMTARSPVCLLDRSRGPPVFINEDNGNNAHGVNDMTARNLTPPDKNHRCQGGDKFTHIPGHARYIVFFVARPNSITAAFIHRGRCACFLSTWLRLIPVLTTSASRSP